MLPGRRFSANPWITLAILAALLAGAGYGWWRSEGGGLAPSGPGSTTPGDLSPGPAAGAGPEDEPAAPDPGGTGGQGGPAPANPLWPFIQPVDLTAGEGVVPRPVAMEAEGTAGILAVAGDRLWFAGTAGEPAAIFQLPPGHRWASPLAPSPDGGAVAFLTRAEAGTPYLWVVHSDLASTPYTVPDGLDRPGAIAWAGAGAVVVGDPPYQLDIESGRWSRLPGAGLVWTGPPSPGGRWWVYGAAAEEGGAGPGLYLVDHRRGGARPLDVGGDADLVAMPGPWLAEDRFLVALGRAGTRGSEGAGSSGGTGGDAVAAAPAVQQLMAVGAGTGRSHRLFDAGSGEAWIVLGASPGGRWVVLVPVSAGAGAGVGSGSAAPTGGPGGGSGDGGAAGVGTSGPWRLLDTTTGAVQDLPAGLAEAGVAWAGGGTWLFYLVPEEAAGAGALRLAAKPLPGENQAEGSGTDGGGFSTGGVAPDRWPGLRPSPAAIRRLLAVDLAAGVAWVELHPGASAGTSLAARWDLAAGRLEPLRGMTDR